MSAEELSSTLTQSPDQLTTTFLQCKICTKLFDEEKHYPRLLPCLHTFCNECIHGEFKNGQMTCPTCKKDHKATTDTLDALFPRDNTRRDLFDFVKVKRAPTAVSCTGCGKNLAQQRCKECAEFLCKECEEAHMRVNQTKGHSLIKLDTLKQSTSMVAFCQPLMCPDHKEKVLELYCSKDTCKKPVCMMCALVKCTPGSGHSISDCNTVAKEKRDEIISQIGGLRDVRTEVSTVTDDVSKEVLQVRGQYEQVIKEIDATFNNLQVVLDQGRERMKQNLKSVVDQKISVLERQKQGLQKHTKQIQNSLEFAEQSLTHTNSPAFLQIERTIGNQLKALTREEFEREPYEIATFDFEHAGLVADIQQCIDRKAKIWTASVYAPNTTFSSDDGFSKDAPATFQVGICDYRGNRPIKSTDQEVVKAVVEEPSGKAVECTISSKDDKKLQVTFTPRSSGRHTMQIKVLDKIVGKHSFDVNADDKDKNKSERRPPPPVPSQPVSPPPSQAQKVSTRDQRPAFQFDILRAHKDVSVSQDGMTFQNWSDDNSPEPVSSNSRLQRYKGVIANLGFQNPGRFVYEMNVNYKILKPLDKSNLVFEIGLARRSAVGNKVVISGEKHAWSMIAAHHTDCDAICLHIANGSHILYHQRLTENVINKVLRKNFRFTIDTNYGRWHVMDCDTGNQLCVIDGVDSSEPLYPVVAGFNPKNVHVTVNLVIV